MYLKEGWENFENNKIKNYKNFFYIFFYNIYRMATSVDFYLNASKSMGKLV